MSIDALQPMPTFHDALLTGIQTEVSRIMLSIEWNNRPITIELSGVLLFHATQFLAGNIILDVTQMHIRHIPSVTEALADLITEGYVNDPIIERMIAADAIWFELTPSYGCSIRAGCEQIRWYDREACI